MARGVDGNSCRKDDAKNGLKFNIDIPPGVNQNACFLWQRMELEGDELEEQEAAIFDEDENLSHLGDLCKFAANVLADELEDPAPGMRSTSDSGSSPLLSVRVSLARGVLSPSRPVDSLDALPSAAASLPRLTPGEFELLHGGPSRLPEETVQHFGQLESPLTDSTPPEVTLHRAALELANSEVRDSGELCLPERDGTAGAVDAAALAEEGRQHLVEHQRRQKIMQKEAKMMLPIPSAISHLFLERGNRDTWRPKMRRVVEEFRLEPALMSVEEDLSVSNDVFGALIGAQSSAFARQSSDLLLLRGPETNDSEAAPLHWFTLALCERIPFATSELHDPDNLASLFPRTEWEPGEAEPSKHVSLKLPSPKPTIRNHPSVLKPHNQPEATPRSGREIMAMFQPSATDFLQLQQSGADIGVKLPVIQAGPQELDRPIVGQMRVAARQTSNATPGSHTSHVEHETGQTPTLADKLQGDMKEEVEEPVPHPSQQSAANQERPGQQHSVAPSPNGGCTGKEGHLCMP